MLKSEIEKFIELDNKKDLGLVVTPPKTADYIISSLTPFRKDEKILDPCVGPGVFVDTLLKSGVKSEQIQTYDINPVYKKKMDNLGISFKNQDYLLSYTPLLNFQFDVILGNPPYLNKSSHYIKKNKKKLQKIFGKINAHETYSMFIVSSIGRLKNGGRLGFITSDSFLTLKTHAKLRKFILNTCKIKEILLAPKVLFDNQDVSTSPAILILEKCTSNENKINRFENIINIIPRVKNEEEYQSPDKIYKIKQSKYHLLPFNIFFTDVEESIIHLFEQAPKLETVLKGYIGMHTHNNLKYIAAVEGTELSRIFEKRNEKINDPSLTFKIISKQEFNSPKWKPYLKRGGSEQYYRPIMEALDWGSESIKNYDIPMNVPFETEGIVISGVSSRLAARYMPEGCYWDSNKAIGFIIKDKTISIFYLLGLLNSSLYNYLAKGIINNTNSLQITGIHALPIIIPDKLTKVKIEDLVRTIMNEKKKNEDYIFSRDQKKIDEIIFNFYSNKFHFPMSLKQKIDEYFANY